MAISNQRHIDVYICMYIYIYIYIQHFGQKKAREKITYL